jgi:hypothetical protein
LRIGRQSRENQVRNFTRPEMLISRFRISSLIESRVILKLFAVSPVGLLAGYEPIISILLNNGMFMLLGKSEKDFVRSYHTVRKGIYLSE